MKPERVFDHFDADVFNGILDSANGSKRILIILDDCMCDNGFKSGNSSNPITKACAIGRNRKVSLIVVSQSYVAIPKDARKNLDMYIGFGQMSESELKDLWNGELCLPWYRYKDFVRDYAQYTKEKFSFIVYNKDEREVYAYSPEKKEYLLIADRNTVSNALNNEN